MSGFAGQDAGGRTSQTSSGAPAKRRRGRGRLIGLLVGVGLGGVCAVGVAIWTGAIGSPQGPSALLDVGGSGTKSTATFTAPQIWDLQYRYDCSNFGAPGNFAVTVLPQGGGAPDVAVNELGSSGQDVTQVRLGGRVHLEILSECTWHVTARA
jgi:hypothetical protein